MAQPFWDQPPNVYFANWLWASQQVLITDTGGCFFVQCFSWLKLAETWQNLESAEVLGGPIAAESGPTVTCNKIYNPSTQVIGSGTKQQCVSQCTLFLLQGLPVGCHAQKSQHQHMHIYSTLKDVIKQENYQHVHTLLWFHVIFVWVDLRSSLCCEHRGIRVGHAAPGVDICGDG